MQTPTIGKFIGLPLMKQSKRILKNILISKQHIQKQLNFVLEFKN